MRFQLIFFTFCLFLALCLGLPYLTGSRPEEGAEDFLSALQAGSIAQIVNYFGNNTCNCPPRGGFISYVKYESGLEPNLAFLVGQHFSQGAPVTKYVASKEPYIVPWNRPESSYVDVALKFNSEKPYFLPLDTSFGIPIAAKDLSSFSANPNADSWKGFYLRLRPTLAPGLIGPPSFKMPPKAHTKEGIEIADTAKYWAPRDAGPVKMPDGQNMPLKDIERALPRLDSAILRLKVVRRGQLSPWRIAKFRILRATALIGGKEIDLSLKPTGQSELEL